MRNECMECYHNKLEDKWGIPSVSWSSRQEWHLLIKIVCNLNLGVWVVTYKRYASVRLLSSRCVFISSCIGGVVCFIVYWQSPAHSIKVLPKCACMYPRYRTTSDIRKLCVHIIYTSFVPCIIIIIFYNYIFLKNFWLFFIKGCFNNFNF